MVYDAIVVGSGAAGMTAAIVLARHGRKVLVLEHNRVPGGLMQCYYRDRCRFPTGVHLLGSLLPGQTMWRYLEYLGVLKQVRLVRMDGEAFQRFCFPDFEIGIPDNHEAAADRLTSRFPQQRAAIEKYFADMKRTVARFAWYGFTENLEGSSAWTDGLCLRGYLDQLTNCAQLRAVLSASNPLYGVEPAVCPTFVHFLVNDTFLNSAWRVDENHRRLAHAFVASLKSLGGELETGATVRAIHCMDGAVRGVELADGRVIESRCVIYTGHPRDLLTRCPPGAFRNVYRQRLADLRDTQSTFGVNVVWRGASCPASHCDYYFYKSWDTDRHYHQDLLADRKSPNMIYCSASPEAKNGLWPTTVLCVARGKEWERWIDASDDEQGYEAAKQEVEQRIMDRLSEVWPDQVTSVRVAGTYSPRTICRYTLSPHGTSYGIMKTVLAGRATLLSSRTRVAGLLQAGQSVTLPGVLGAIISGVDACTALLDRNQLMRQIREGTS